MGASQSAHPLASRFGGGMRRSTRPRPHRSFRIQETRKTWASILPETEQPAAGALLPQCSQVGRLPGELSFPQCVCVRVGGRVGGPRPRPFQGTGVQIHRVLISTLGKGIAPRPLRLNVTEFVLGVAVLNQQCPPPRDWV